MKVFVTTIPFGEINELPLAMLKDHDIEFHINPYGRKITTEELSELIHDYDGLIAGTEIIDASVLDKAKKLKIISRVGIGLDGVDLNLARDRGITCTYTPDAPAPAVAELTMGLILQLARRIGTANSSMKNGLWRRYDGFRIPEMTIGVIGVGRIGARVIRRLSAFGSPRILVNDLNTNKKITDSLKLSWVTKDQIYQESDLITTHVPLTLETKGLISSRELGMMKPSAMLINTARGGIVDEEALYNALDQNIIHSAAIDVFEKEPYSGPLTTLDNCFLTCHMGSMSFDCRSRMEIEATQEIINYYTGAPHNKLVPNSEYLIQNVMG